MDWKHLPDQELLDLVLGLLAPEEEGASRHHCMHCPQCRERLEGARCLAEGLRQLGHAADLPSPSMQLYRRLSEGAEPLLEELRHTYSRPTAKRPVPRRRIGLSRRWAVAASVVLLVGAGGGVLLLWSGIAPSAAAVIVESTGPVKIAPPGQPARHCQNKGELVRIGDCLSTTEADGAVRLDDATVLALRRGCRLEAQRPEAGGQATFALRDGTLCVDTTNAKRGCSVRPPGGTVRCHKAKTVICVTSPQGCTVTTLEGQVEVKSSGQVGVVSSGGCAELKRSKPCSYRPARPEETRCDWVNRCGKANDGRNK